MDNTFRLKSGKEVRLIPVPPLLQTKITKSVPRPKPPVQLTDLGPIANPDHPAYKAELEEWAGRVNEKYAKAMLELGTEIEFDPAEVAAFKSRMQAYDPELSFEGESDKYIYLTCIAITTQAELNALGDALRRMSEATEEEVAEAVASFPG